MSEDYVHGYSAAEMRRLTRMQEILNDLELAALDLGGVRRLLDVGSGLGQMARALARRLGRPAVVVGVERDGRQRQAAAEQAVAAGEQGLVEFRAGDGTSLPLSAAERGHFDLAHARFLLEHVTDPLACARWWRPCGPADGSSWSATTTSSCGSGPSARSWRGSGARTGSATATAASIRSSGGACPSSCARPAHAPRG